MKAILVTLCFFITCLYTASQSHEIVKIKKPSYRSVRFSDDLHGWIAGYKGVFYTEDGGQKWHKQPVIIGSATQYSAVAAMMNTGWIAWADTDEAIICSDAGLVFGKANSDDWRKINLPAQTLARLYVISFVDRYHGWGAGNGAFFRSQDGGHSWEANDFHLISPAKSIFALSPNECWIAGGLTAIAHTSNEGNSFHYQQLSPGNTADLLFINFKDSQYGWACGTNGLIYRTTNGGATWERLSIPVSNKVAFSSLSFASRVEGWAVGSKYNDGDNKGDNAYEYVFLYTVDGGITWIDRTTIVKDSFLGIQALPNGGAWVVGMDGTVLKTSDGGKRWSSIALN